MKKNNRRYIYVRVRLPEDSTEIYKAIKVAAAKEGKTIGKWALEAMISKLTCAKSTGR